MESFGLTGLKLSFLGSIMWKETGAQKKNNKNNLYE